MGPAQHHLSYPLEGWRIVREETTVRLLDPRGAVMIEQDYATEPLARKGLWEMRQSAYESAEAACQ